MTMQLDSPVLLIGLGGAGSRLAVQSADRLDADVLVMSNDPVDLQGSDSIRISTAPVVNPSVQTIRGSAYGMYGEIRSRISGYRTVILMANLAGRAGSALAPLLLRMCRDAGIETVSFAIMPFRYEKRRIFDAGMSLKRLREDSGCTIVLDNDALLESNPDLSPNECYDIGNRAILHVAGSLGSGIDPDTSILSTGPDRHDIEESLRDSLKMLYNNAAPDSVRCSILHVAGGNDIPAGVLSSIASITCGVLEGSDSQISLESTSSEESRIMMLSNVHGMTKFDRYDPLGIIPRQDTLDWSEPECSTGCKMDLYQLE